MAASPSPKGNAGTRLSLEGLVPGPLRLEEDAGAHPGAASHRHELPRGLRITEVLAVGAASTVFEAFDGERGRSVVVKEFVRTDSADPSERRRMVDRVRALRGVAGPGLVEILAFSDEGERAFLVMEHVRGRSLRAGLDELGVREIVRLAAGLAETLARLHDAGLTHGRLDAGDVLVRGDLRAVLVGFSLGRGEEGRPAGDLRRLGRVLEDLLGVGGRVPDELRSLCQRARASVFESAEALATELRGWLASTS